MGEHPPKRELLAGRPLGNSDHGSRAALPRLIERDGAATVSDVNAGTMRHMTGGSNETIEIISGSPRAILFQLK